MTLLKNKSRRTLLSGVIGIAAGVTTPLWAQSKKGPNRPVAPLVVAQIVDVGVDQLEVSRDFLIGARAAWQEVNLKGGVQGRTVHHMTLEVDGTPASMQMAIDSVRDTPQCITISGTAGDRATLQLIDGLRKEKLEMAHSAPWMQSGDLALDDVTFPIFASRQDQIAQALKSLAVMGVPEVGVVYASGHEQENHQSDIDKTGERLGIKLKMVKPAGDLATMGQRLPADTPRILLFVGGTPELVQFREGADRQARRHYVVALANVNLQTMMQMGATKRTPVMATQVVPMVNSPMPIVKTYREALLRLFDEPPTPQSLAGYISAQYTSQILSRMEGAPTRQNALAAFRKRIDLDLGGFQVSFQNKRRTSNYVTQSMITPDGRLIG